MSEVESSRSLEMAAQVKSLNGKDLGNDRSRTALTQVRNTTLFKELFLNVLFVQI